MLIVNWKKHYHVPGLFFNDIRFTSTRKGKFYYLSDLVFRVIHKFCLKVCLYYYIRYSFFYRFKKTCLHINRSFTSKTSFVKKNINYIFFNAHTISKSSNDVYNYSAVLKNRKKLIVHFNFFLRFTRYLINKNINSDHKFFLNHYFLYFNNTIISIMLKYFFYFLLNKLKIVKSVIRKKYASSNFIFILYQIVTTRTSIQLLMFFFNSIINIFNIYKSYIKQSPFLNNLSVSTLEYPITYDLYKLKNLLPIDMNWKKNYFLYINFISNFFHDFFSHFFFLRKLNLYKSLKFLNFVNTNNLIYKKEIIHKFRKQFRIFKMKLNKYRHRYAYRFYLFLIRTFYAKKNWLLGPVHKSKFFKYIFLIYNKLKCTLKNVFFFKTSSVRKKEQLSFFFDSPRIREHFFLYLGKKRYSEEFLLLKNKKWYLKSYLTFFYNIDLTFLCKYYKELRHKYNIFKIKDLFVFIEHHIFIFLNKYFYYTYSNNDKIIINERSLVNNNFFFFIGDFFKMNISVLNKYIYEKFYIFFNIIYFINPLFFNKKLHILSNLYIYLYNNLFCKTFFIYRYNNINSYNSYTKKIINSIYSFLNIFTYNDYIKIVYLLFNKFNIKCTPLKSEISHLVNNDISIFESISKVYFKIDCIKFDIINNNSCKKRIEKRFWWLKKIKANKMFWSRKKRNSIKKHFFTNFYKFYKYHLMNSSTDIKKKYYKKSLYTKFNHKNYKSYLLKKLFFLDNNSKLSTIL